MSAPTCQWRRLDRCVDLARLHALDPARYPHLLESVAHGPPQARYDILFAFPGDLLTLDAHGQAYANGAPRIGGFLELLDAAWQGQAVAAHDHLPFPFHGGWFLFLGYELAAFLEPALAGLPRGDSWPVAWAQRFPAAVIRDHAEDRTYLLCETTRPELLAALEDDLAALPAEEDTNRRLPAHSCSEEDPTLYRQRIARTLEYIRAGETYQANLSRLWRVEFTEPPRAYELYRHLRRANPAPFAGLVTLGEGRAILSSSPERLVSVRGGRVTTRPIAGTFPRAAESAEDQQLAQALIRHPKERAEHVMLVDLERNDLGRVCEPGSVRADELLTVESYRHVHHIVSNVTGELRAGVTPAQVIRALFPGGTITGCPKLRTMQIIAELDGAARGVYTGSIGYLNRDGSLDLNILIRTLVLDGNRVQLRAGGGIVADSDPERELNETRAKAKGLLAALGVAA
jgi:anthranilate synthase component 1